jgi:hypothetical protein
VIAAVGEIGKPLVRVVGVQLVHFAV